jgi:predicted signal transduction protein with EAL and GGDEF domain
VNEGASTAIGNRLVLEISRRLVRSARPGDSVARIGGDEFAVLVEDVADADQVRAVADRLRAALAEPVVLGPRVYPITSSMGSALATHGAPAALLKHAQQALAAAKSAGGNRFELYDQAMRVELYRRADVTNAIRHALAGPQIALAYTPIVELASGEVIGHEATPQLLTRRGEPIGGAELGPVAQAAGLAVHLGRAVLAEACAQIGRVEACGFPLERVALDISAHELEAPDFLTWLEGELERAGIAPHAVGLEFRESVMAESGASTQALVAELCRLGFTVAIDGFGAGPANLSALRDCPVRIIKVDPQVIGRLTSDPYAAAFAAAVVAVATALDKVTVADGVTSAADHEAVLAAGFARAEGPYYARDGRSR